LFEFSGTALEVENQIERVQEISKQNNCNQFKFAVEEEERQSLWLARKVALWSSKALRPSADLWITGIILLLYQTIVNLLFIQDVCVPISRLADIINATKDDLKNSPLQAPLVVTIYICCTKIACFLIFCYFQSHAGDGNFHLFILFDPNEPSEMQEAHRINENLIKRAIEMEGTCTGEHGTHTQKKRGLPKLYSFVFGAIENVKNQKILRNL